MTRDLQDHIDEVMDNFDFGRVERVMDFLNWKWLTLTPARVPDQGEMRQAARRYLREAAKMALQSGQSSTGSGGFMATAWANTNTGKIECLHMTFSLTDWHTAD